MTRFWQRDDLRVETADYCKEQHVEVRRLLGILR